MAIDLIQELRLLEDPEPDYKKLLETLCELERRYSEIKTRIKVGLSEDIKDAWEIIKVCDQINKKISTRLEEIAVIDNAKVEKDLRKIIEINDAINDKIRYIIKEKRLVTNSLPNQSEKKF